MSVIVKSLRKIYNTKKGVVEAISDISFEIKKGEYVSVHGASGCGKSTLLLTIGGLLAPTSGMVSVNSINPYELNQVECSAFRSNNIGFVFQQFHLIPYLNVIDNIKMPSLAIDIDDIDMKIAKLLKKFKLEDRVTHLPSMLSIGEQQRVAMARALIHNPKIILADEPTGNLDPENTEIVLNTFEDFVKEEGIVIMVTHDNIAINAAQRSLAIERGVLKK